jgi:hypothetical protein
LSEEDIFKKFYIHLLDTYKEAQFQEKYKYSFIDSTVIYNQYESNKNTVNNDNNFNSTYKEKNRVKRKYIKKNNKKTIIKIRKIRNIKKQQN